MNECMTVYPYSQCERTGKESTVLEGTVLETCPALYCKLNKLYCVLSDRYIRIDQRIGKMRRNVFYVKPVTPVIWGSHMENDPTVNL